MCISAAGRRRAARPRRSRPRDAPKGMKWIENDKVRLLLGPEGAHVYRWEVKALKNRDLTEPGETGWAGFSDAGMDHREIQHALRLHGPRPGPGPLAVLRPDGPGEDDQPLRRLLVDGGRAWRAGRLLLGLRRSEEFRRRRSHARQYLFSNGASGPGGQTRRRRGGPGQRRPSMAVSGAIKFNEPRSWAPRVWSHPGDRPPSLPASPPARRGGVGIESSVPASHFITFGGMLKAEPKATMTRLPTDPRLPQPAGGRALRPRTCEELAKSPPTPLMK